MGQVLHGSATTTEAGRRAIQHSQASLRDLARRFGVNPKTIAKWRKRTSVADLPTGPREARSTTLSAEQEAIVVAFRRHTLLPLDDCLYALQPSIPQLTRSALHRCLQRHGISRLPEVEGDRPTRKAFKAYPIGFFHIDIAEVQTAEGKLFLFVAIDRTSKFAFVQLVDSANRVTLPPSPRRRRALQDPHSADGQRHPVPFRAALRQRAYSPLHDPHVRHAMPGKRHRAPVHQNQPSLDQWPGRADEPNHQGRDGQALPLRQPRSAPATPQRLRRS
jgi:transposase